MKINKILIGGSIAAFAITVFVVVPAIAASTFFGSAVNNAGVVEVESILSNVSTADDFGGITFDDVNGSFISGLTNLATDYNVTNDDCAGGSPRFSIRVDFDNDNVVSAGDKNVFVYLGPHPSFSGCTPNTMVSSGNLTTNPDPRWDTSQVGGTFYDTFANASALTSTNEILRINLVVDAGWAFPDSEQTILFDNVSINGITYDFEPTPTPTITPVPTVTPTPGPFAVPVECSGIAGLGAPIIGTNGSNNISGTSGNDLIFGRDGSDRIDGKGGDDCIVAGDGADTVFGKNGDDVILGGDGADTINGENGSDTIYGQGGADTIRGGNQADTLNGGGGWDSARGENGTDTCVAESKNSCEL